MVESHNKKPLCCFIIYLVLQKANFFKEKSWRNQLFTIGHSKNINWLIARFKLGAHLRACSDKGFQKHLFLWRGV